MQWKVTPKPYGSLIRHFAVAAMVLTTPSVSLSAVVATDAETATPSDDEIPTKQPVIVVTASKSDETVLDAPAVVTVVSREEIENMGARTLQDVLWTLPGFTRIQDNNETVVAVRGVFATTNQKFLVLRDGHRLNEPLFENVAPDYSVSLDNVERIEIVRGPGASLYGNAALTTVINLITIRGADVDGASFRVAGGVPGQLGASGLYGKKFGDTDVLFYGHFSSTEGETLNIGPEDDFSTTPRAGELTVDRYPSNFDVGVRISDGRFTISGALRRSDFAQPKGNGGQTIDADAQWHPLEQIWEYQYLDFLYQEALGNNVDLSLRHYLDVVSYESWQLSETIEERPPDGNIFSVSFNASRVGINYSLNYFYDFGSVLQGDILVGANLERWELHDSFFLDNQADASTVARQRTPLLPEGTEYNGAGYVQLRNEFIPQLKLNLGVRYDIFEAFGGSLNPRAAVVSPLFDWLNLKVIYARAFQAPSYFYRQSNPALGYGSTEELEPEIMESFQAAAQFNAWGGTLQINYFRNQLRNLINRDPDPDPDLYRNFGELDVQGIEVEVEYAPLLSLSTFANYTFHLPVVEETADILLINELQAGIPKHTANAGVTFVPLPFLSLNAWVNLTSEILYRVGGRDPIRVAPRGLVNVTAVLRDFPSGAFLSMSVHNLLDYSYQLGGTTPPFQQAGRWIRAVAGYQF